ncbi:single-strand DNA-binding protein [Trinickia symbiotica]|uniref:Single-stranded DNA-binding protein n=2 Tax=Trinickia symbiotica TaxID=863227 RepID=A0A2N7WTJ4_9BURK|nr:single-stranded DNA-binding protein [Trinickia symbiotica]PMS32661.1 single-stranded DNA-binding protein [Trinickia symbiotica]PPK41772.1 single-strand DNA-binding protein [Trinickia symbiotica]
MGIYAELVGNVLASPTMKQVNTASGARRIVELRVMSASYRRLDDGSLEQRDGRTFPVDVTIWNERLTERVLQHIRTGASVVVRGDFYVSPWINRDNEPDAGAHIDAESISLNLVRIDQVVYRPRQMRESDAPAQNEGASEPAGPPDGEAEESTSGDEPGAPPDHAGSDAATSGQPAGRRSRRAARATAE